MLKECKELDQIFSKMLSTEEDRKEVMEKALRFIKALLEKDPSILLPPNLGIHKKEEGQ